MKRILLIKTSSMGDVIHNLPVVNDICQHFPGAQIDWVAEEGFADIPRMHPRINQVIPVAMRRWRKRLWHPATWQEMERSKQSLSLHGYDAVIDTQGLLKSALIARYTQGSKHGYDKTSIREPIASRFYEHTYAISYQQHAVVRNRILVAMSLSYPVPETPPDYGIQADEMELELPEPFVMGLHATSRASKLWPETHWIELGRELTKTRHFLFLPWGNTAEFERATRIANQLENGIVLPKLGIAQLASVIARAKAAIGVDTGLSHLAAALNIPTIAIYTDTDPALTGVMAGSVAPAVNFGGIQQIPQVSTVLETMHNIAKL